MRSTTADAARRAMMGVVRGIWQKSDDTKLIQEGQAQFTHSETRQGVERHQNYGFWSVPLPPSKNDQGVEQHAEVTAVSVGGNRSNMVILAVDDPRHRPKNLKEGEAIQADDLGQKVHLTRDGIVISSPKAITLQVDGGAAIKLLPNGKVALIGTIALGDENADRELALKGSTDSAGDTEQGNLSTKVKAK